jgi:phage FluMu protein Com
MSERAAGDKSPATPGSDASLERRCACGKLAARLTTDGVEIKCSRCKSVTIVSWSEMPKEGALSSESDD